MIDRHRPVLTPQQRSVRSGIATNVLWCDAVCRAAGLTPARSAATWAVSERTPVGYPDAITQIPGLTADAALATTDAGAGASVKDSYRDLDLAGHGFAVLFDATWITRPAGPGERPVPDWGELVTTAGIDSWLAERRIVVDPEVLAVNPSVRMFRSTATGASCCLTVSEDAVGLACLEYGAAEPLAAWSQALGVALRHGAGLPVVGYEHGPELELAVTSGFAPVGPLRVWLRP